MTKLRAATVGLGWVATHRHLPVMKSCGDFEVVGVIDRAPGRARQIVLQGGYRNFAETTNLAEVAWLRDVDVVTIATAPVSHYPLIRQALELGKHVLTEKPFTMTVREGEEVASIAREKNLRLGIVHNFQFARSTKRLLAEIQRGELGTVRSVSAVQLGNPQRRLPKWYDQLPLGLMYDESPHLLYLLRCMAGDVRLKRCIVHPSTTGLCTPARIDAFFQSADFPGSITLSCNFESPLSEWYLIAFGQKRLGIVDIFRDIYLSLPNDGTHGTADVFRTSVYAIGQHLWQHLASGIPHFRGNLFYGTDEVFLRFARAVRGSISELDPINAESALAVLRLQHSMVERQERIDRDSSG